MNTKPNPTLSSVSPLKKVAGWVFDALASMELAVIIILSIAAISATGTVYESWYGADVASLVVYRSWFFTVVLIVFMLNLLFAALSRLPWKRHHIGFLITHLGLIILLIGSVVTRYWGVDGSIALGAGESARTVRMNTNYLNVFVATAGNNYEKIYSEPVEYNPIRGFPGAITHSLKLKEFPGNSGASRIDLKILDWWPMAHREVGAKPDPNQSVGVPAVRFRLMGSRANIEEWLFLNGIQGSTIDLGPALVRFQQGKPELKEAAAKRTLFIYTEDRKQKLPKLAQVAAKSMELQFMGVASFEKPVNLGWMDFQFLLEEFHQYATPFSNYTKVDKKRGSVEALRVSLGNEERWLELGAAAQVALGDSLYFLQYTKQEIPLGFEIGLNKFDVSFYQGSARPKSYESRVHIPGKGDDFLISMNEPLKHGGYTFYQSSYSMDEEGKPVISVLSVNFDPGRWIKYLGCIMLVSGILLMFYFKPIYSGRNKYLAKSKA